MHNLIVDLRDERFGGSAQERYVANIEAAGVTYQRGGCPNERVLAWIDLEFGGSWSSEAAAGQNIALTKDGAPVAFATHQARGLKFFWLRSLETQPDTGLFGPFGVAPSLRGSSIGVDLLLATLCELRVSGYKSALIPAVGSQRLIDYYHRHTGATIQQTFELYDRAIPPYRTTVLASGNGTNFQTVLDAVKRGELPLQIEALITNNAAAYAVQRARAAVVPLQLALPWNRAQQGRERYDDQLLDAVLRARPQLVLLLGWMHLLPARFLEAVPEIINIHPAFLPLDQGQEDVGLSDGTRMAAFRGPHAVRDALAAGTAWAGATAHGINLDADRGPVLVRRPLLLRNVLSESAVMEKLRPIEHEVLLGGIRRWVFEQPN